jgi:aminoglycoside phosphotransferase (APT) family kinase protein
MSANDNFVGTRPVSEAHQFDVGVLEAWLKQHMPGFAGPLSVEMFKGGQSNPTFKLITPSTSYVMRAKPGPVAKLLPSAHAVEREFAVMRGLYGTAVPVAQMHVLCEDESVIGRAFYVMEFVQGRVLWDQSLPDMTKQQRRDIYNEMNRVIAALHSVPYAERGLENFGKPGNYFERQIGRWSKQYIASITQPIPEMDKLMEWLPANMPDSARDGRTSIVHGDYRLDNMMFHPGQRVAVVDWQTSNFLGTGMDVAYFLGGALSREVRQANEQALLQGYHAELLAHGVKDYSFEHLMNDYRHYSFAVIAVAIAATLIVKRTERGDAMLMQMTIGGALQALDNHSLDLLPD